MTMRMDAAMVKEFKTIQLSIKNRRLQPKADEKDEKKAIYRGNLFKLKQDGDRLQEKDWTRRDMWLSRKHSLVYWSEKESRELVYYTGNDLMNATVSAVQDDFMAP